MRSSLKKEALYEVKEKLIKKSLSRLMCFISIITHTLPLKTMENEERVFALTHNFALSE